MNQQISSSEEDIEREKEILMTTIEEQLHEKELLERKGHLEQMREILR